MIKANTMTPAEQAISERAIAHAKSQKKKVAGLLTDLTIYTPEQNPVAVFMSGSPGAGKTEAALSLIESFGSVVLIDPDSFRDYFDEYDGSNAWLFQGAVSILVEKVLDFAFKRNLTFLLDGTLTNAAKARANIERCLKRVRFVQIIYVYQDPLLAWNFVQAREVTEGRRIRPENFIDQYFEARNVVNMLKAEFKSNIRVDLLVKNVDNSSRFYKMNVDSIDRHIPEKHSRADLEQKLLTSGESK